MGTLHKRSRAEVAELIGSTRSVVQHLLFGGSIDVGQFIAELEPLFDDSLDERERAELAACRENLARQTADHIVLDASFRMLSVLESIESRYAFARNN